MSQFVLNKNHPLIPREHNYVLERKILTVHSVDRDISKWPKGNYFEIDLPEDFTNVQSMRLVQITLPNSHYVFTNDYQNTKLEFSIVGDTHPYKGPYSITISEGSYTAEELAIEIANKMNQAVSYTHGLNPPYHYIGFICKYNAVTNTFWFGNNGKMGDGHNFSLEFHNQISYDLPCTQPEVWGHYSNWGLPAYLGYCRKQYKSSVRDASAEYINTTGGFGFAYEDADKPWLPPGGVSWVHVVDISGGTDSADGNCCQLNIHGETSIYMEIERYNSMDELVPWAVNTMGSYNNDYSGKVNSAFAKIPIGMAHAFALYGDSKNFFLMNSTTFTPPLERINRLRFKFRFHDGRLVDFKCVPFDFSLEINMLRDQPAKKMNVRVPASFI